MGLEVVERPGGGSALYAATSAGFLCVFAGAGCLYACTDCGGDDWQFVGGDDAWDPMQGRWEGGFSVSLRSSRCETPELWLGGLAVDRFWRYPPLSGQLERLDDHDGSCIWALTDFDGEI